MTITTVELMGLVTPSRKAASRRIVRDGKTVKVKKRKNKPETLRAYRESHKDEIAAMKKRWKESNPQRAKESQRRADRKRCWNDPERYRAIRLARWNAVGAAQRAAKKVK